MAEFTLVSYSIEPVNANITAQNAPPINASIGDEIQITLNYSFDEVLTGDLWYNVGLFVNINEDLIDADNPPTSGYFINVRNTATMPQTAMGLRGTTIAEKNGDVTFEKTSAQNFTIIHTLFLTEDVNDWLVGQGLINQTRFLKSSTRELEILQETTPSAYLGGNKNFGFLVAINRPIVTTSSNNGLRAQSGGAGVTINQYVADSPIFMVDFEAFVQRDKLEIFVDKNDGNGAVLTATTGITAGGNYGNPAGTFDGNGGAGFPLNSHPTPVVETDFFVGSEIPNVPSRRNEYVADTGDDTVTELSVNTQLVWVTGLSNGDIVSIRVAGEEGTIWSYQIRIAESATQEGGLSFLHSYVPCELQFLNEDATNREFNITNSGTPATKLATFDTNDIEINVDYSVLTLEKIRYSLINVSNDNDQTDFITNYQANFQDTPAPTQNGNTFTTNISISGSSLNANDLYRIICVGYDETNDIVRTWISEVLQVNSNQVVCPTVVSRIENFTNSYATNHIELSTLQPIQLVLEITEISAINSITLNFAGDFALTANKIGGNWITNDSLWVVSQVGSVITSTFGTKDNNGWKIPLNWSGTTKDIVYSFGLGSDVANYKQRLVITPNAPNSELTAIDLADLGGSPISDFCTIGENEYVRQTITKDSAYNGRQMYASLDSTANIKNETAWDGGNGFGILSENGIQNVDENFTGDLINSEFAPYLTLPVFTGAVFFAGQNFGFISFSFQAPDQLRTFWQSTIDSYSGGTLLTKFLTASNVSFKVSLTNDFTSSPSLTLAQFQAETGLNGQFIEISTTSLDSNFDGGGILTFSIQNSVVSPKTLTINIDADHPDQTTAIPITRDTDLIDIRSTNNSTVFADFSTFNSATSDWTNYPALNVGNINTLKNAMSANEIGFIRPYWRWTTTTAGNFAGNVQIELANTTAENFGHFGNFNIINGDYRTAGIGNAWQHGGSRYIQYNNFVEFASTDAWTVLFFFESEGVRNGSPTIQTVDVNNFRGTGIEISADYVLFGENYLSNQFGGIFTNGGFAGTSDFKRGYNIVIITYDGSLNANNINFYYNHRLLPRNELRLFNNGNLANTTCLPATNTVYLNTRSGPSANQTIGGYNTTNARQIQMVSGVRTTAEITEAFKIGSFVGVVPDNDFMICPNLNQTGTTVPPNQVPITGSDSNPLLANNVNGVQYGQFYP